MRALMFATALAAVLLPYAASAQDSTASPGAQRLPSPSTFTRALDPLAAFRLDGAAAQSNQEMEGRACAGCPKRRVLVPYLESVGLNVVYNVINQLSGDEGARVGPSSWWSNMKAGFEWDPNPFLVNQIGHPYQGSNYFTAGRANGMSFWESTSVAAFGSATWEFFAESNRASLNDLINTTLGGVAVGEVLHRAAWLVRDPTGENRKTREILATVIDPMSGLSRMISGDANREAEKPASMMPSSVTFPWSSGAMWQGASLHDVQSSIRPYFEGDMLYGDLRSGRSKLPYEAFAVRVAFGGGNPISQVGVRGRLLALPFGGGPAHQFSIFQTFDFIQNNAYEFGGQGVEVEFATTRRLSSRASLWMAGWGGVSLLAAVNSLVAPPEGAVVPSGGGTYADRLYDYGPGARWGAAAELSRAGTPRASLVYQAYQVFVVDGRRASHVLQRLHLDLRWPVKGPLALGAAGELFFRKAYFWAATDRTDSSPQFRLFLAWSRQP